MPFMKITESILKRRSVRTYTGERLDDATIRKITDYIAGLEAPLGASCRIEIVRTAAAASTDAAASAATSARPVKLGTYGAIRGASDFLVLVIRDEGPFAQEGAAYMFEQVVLYCTSLGLGTCWLAGFFDRGGFKKRLALRPGERLRSVSPIGYAAIKPHRSISTLLNGGKPTPRKPFSEIFFRGGFGEPSKGTGDLAVALEGTGVLKRALAWPLTEEAAGEYRLPLEMVRRAPSANNKQPWRVVLGEGALHFYTLPSMGYERLDMGIALCHFEQACREIGIAGHYEVLPGAPEGKKATYLISWVAE